jgi:predicted DCC family thiol-disulfide oxidoreductase YuxK
MATANPTRTTAPKAVVLYDGQCPLCQRSVKILKRLDWFKRLDCRDARDAGNWPETAVPFDMQRLMEEMHVVTPDRKRVYHGFGAFRYMARSLPLVWPVLPLLYVPGVPRVGQWVYLKVAKNRFDLVPCHDGQCQIPKRTEGKELRTE